MAGEGAGEGAVVEGANSAGAHLETDFLLPTLFSILSPRPLLQYSPQLNYLLHLHLINNLRALLYIRIMVHKTVVPVLPLPLLHLIIHQPPLLPLHLIKNLM